MTRKGGSIRRQGLAIDYHSNRKHHCTNLRPSREAVTDEKHWNPQNCICQRIASYWIVDNRCGCQIDLLACACVASMHRYLCPKRWDRELRQQFWLQPGPSDHGGSPIDR